MEFRELRELTKALHDGPAQSVMAANLLASIIARSLRSEGHPLADDAEALLRTLTEASSQIHHILRTPAFPYTSGMSPGPESPS